MEVNPSNSPKLSLKAARLMAFVDPSPTLHITKQEPSSEFHDWVDLGRKGTAGVRDTIQNRGSSQELESEVTART